MSTVAFSAWLVSVFAEGTTGGGTRGAALALNGLQITTVARPPASRENVAVSFSGRPEGRQSNSGIAILAVPVAIVKQGSQAQTSFASNPANPAILSETSASILQDGNLYPKLYPELSQYMGISLNDEEIQRNLAMVPAANSQGLVARPASDYMVAPVTGNDVGIRRAEIKQGIRELILCKDQDGKIGLRLKSVDNGVFAQLVQANSPASLAGLRFGDQVLQINGENCAGWSSDKAHKILKQTPGERISMIIRDRPFGRTITMHKDSTGHVGFIFKNGKITSIVKDSSAARNGLLTEHNICEINGQNVIGLKDSQIADILSTAGNVVTITIMPSQVFEHIIKRMASSIMKSLMDHTIPEV